MSNLESTDPILDGDYKQRWYSTTKCLNAARRRGNKVFALKDGGECLSSSDDHLDVVARYEKAEDCQSNKGNINAMDIFVIKGKKV